MPDTLFDAVLALLLKTGWFEQSTLEAWIYSKTEIYLHQQYYNGSAADKQHILNKAIGLILK